MSLDAKIALHLTRLRKAGLETEPMFTALEQIRTDTTLSPAHRELLLRMIAHESGIWYEEARTGQPVDREKIYADAKARLEKKK